jgi:phage repressor protein C with HTH and peptisase S24 domain
MPNVKGIKHEDNLDFSLIFPILQQSLGIKTQEELAERLGIQSQAISNAKAKNKMSVKWIHRLAEKGFIPWDQLGNILSQKRTKTEQDELKFFEAGPTERPVLGEPLREDEGEFVDEIPVPYGVAGTKGRKCRILIELIQRWADEIFPPEVRPNIFAWVVDEDNMEPTIRRKSLVLIDGRDRDLKAMGIFAFRMDGRLTLRRTSPYGDGINIDLVNDNRNYPSTHYPEQLLMDEGPPLQVVGRVIFHGFKL